MEKGTMKVGVLGGVHEDIIRLREAFTIFENNDCATVVCLGDVIGYDALYYGYPDSRDAHACIQLVREKCQYAVIGNHDLFAIRQSPRHTVFKHPKNWYALDYSARKQISSGAVWLYEDDLPASLTTDDTDYLAALPEFLVAELGGTKVLFSHYADPNLVGDCIEFDPADHGIQQHFQFMQAHGCHLGIFDHDDHGCLRIFTGDRVEELAFGGYPLPEGMAALNGPWVANGTSPNGVLVIDFAARQVEAIPLNTPIHRAP
jgi:predicted phosphodiesterase